jgi:hypothetical protein
MIDAEVSRLRGLRIAALRARSLAAVLEVADTGDSVFTRCAVVCWGIVRLTSGRLRAHPYVSYQQGPSAVRQFMGDALAALTGFVAGKQGRKYSVFAEQLQLLARELDDVRSVTWSGDLSDALGRYQTELRGLLEEVACASRREIGAAAVTRTDAEQQAESTATNWPYLAI